MLRLILKYLNPFNGEMSQKKTFLWRLRLWLFGMSIRTLKNLYRQYGFLDIINIGDVEIRQSKRDLEFEKWLSSLKMDIRPHLFVTSEMPVSMDHRWWRPFYHFFHMEYVTLISYGKNEIILNRTCDLTMIANVKGVLKIADETDILQRSEFKAIVPNRISDTVKNGNQPIEPRQAVNITKDNPNGTKTHNKVSLGEVGSIDLPDSRSVTQRTEPTIIQVQGAEIDESF